MISLRDLQRSIVSFSLGESAAVPDEWIVTAGLDTTQRLEIYRNNAQIGFAKALQATFPALVRLAGQAWFDQTAQRYQSGHPSRSGDLGQVGSGFAAFLDEILQDSDYEYFADVARLEWAYCEALHQSPAGPADFAALQTAQEEDYEQVRFVLHPSAQLIESRYPLFAIWQSNRAAVESDEVIDLRRGASQVLVLRQADHVAVQELTRASGALLAAFLQRFTLRPAIERALGQVGEFDLVAALGQLIGLGVLRGVQGRVAGSEPAPGERRALGVHPTPADHPAPGEHRAD